MAKLRAGYVRLCEFPIDARHRKKFERIYGPEGDWVKLFRKGKGFLRTDLYRDTAKPGRYITADFWISESACKRFQKKFGAEYDALNVKCAAFNGRERPIGDFILLG